MRIYIPLKIIIGGKVTHVQTEIRQFHPRKRTAANDRCSVKIETQI